ncbi:MAG: DUF1573 domain-containing protein [Saprospiraceae bacterium]|jgi:hypothetical protein
MKQFLFTLLVLVSISLNAQTKVAPIPIKTEGDMKKEAMIEKAKTEAVAEVAVERTNAKMTFESLTVDYGTIENGSEPLRVVKFTNTGTEPLVIKNARGSCGCTVPTWTKEPIAPGQSSTLEIRYDTKRTGAINKSVTITTNEGPDNHVLQVIGTVLAPKEEKAVPQAEPSIIKGK